MYAFKPRMQAMLQSFVTLWQQGCLEIINKHKQTLTLSWILKCIAVVLFASKKKGVDWCDLHFAFSTM